LRIFLSTADASGDLHASSLVAALRRRRPDLEVYGLGGERLRGAGLDAVVSQSDLAVGGLVEVLPRLPGLLGAYARLRRSIVTRAPDLALLVDSPDLNLPLASVAHRRGVRVLYYIAPQVWAWRTGRVRKLRRRVDRLGVIFPFEEPLFREAGLDATFLGHPLVDRIAELRAGLDPAAAARELELDPARPVLGLLPGSRRNELAANLEPMVEAARLVRDALPDLQVLLPLAPTLERQPPDLPEFVRLVTGRTHEAMALSTCLLAAPGTATVEAALLGVPTVIVHRANPLSFALAQRVVRVPSSSMLNLIAGAGIVPERLQGQARPAALAALVARWLRRPEAREAAVKEISAAAALLGRPGAVERAADWVLESAGDRPGAAP
jgi:lipid-A-disaccharide synthase